MKTVRCAIYTRKSVDEGLDDAFNSLDSQRSYCEDYIKGQKHNGWIILPKHYDDGGYSGKNMKRPAMQELIKDVEEGNIDVIVVYKVDRLSRSLLDFANFSSFLEEHNVSFVLVTQNVDTTTTMGRMQLNLLMTFAQYEREMCSDRIKDKVAAMKKRGMWTGGYRPYGYDIKDKQLVINPIESEILQEIFKRYVQLGSTYSVAHELNEKGIHYTNASGRWRHNIILRILKTKLYIGVVTYQGQEFEGQHPPIINKVLWNEAQAILKEREPYKCHAKDISIALFRSMVICGECEQPMRVEVHTKGGKKYGYYTCPKGLHGSEKGKECRMPRIPTKKMDGFILQCCQHILANSQEVIIRVAEMLEQKPNEVHTLLKDKQGLLKLLPPFKLFAFVRILIKNVRITRNEIYITFNEAIFANDMDGSPKTATFPLVLSKEEYSLKIADLNGSALSNSALTMIKAIYESYRLADLFISNGYSKISELAKAVGQEPVNIRRKLALYNISPTIIRAILYQKGGFDLSVNKLVNVAHLPWEEQEKVLEL